ncbi:MAG TPA: DUF5362 domain-containing protein [bacterium]|nr:DUF5362 domain-containing protein [bacterium]HPN44056.1 DUF5362 domain-containing protein [bacterium]
MSTMSPVANQNVQQMNSDMRFVGMFCIIYGGFCCLSIIGAVVGVPLIFCGLRLREAADSFTTWMTNKDENALTTGFEKQGRFFYIQKILIIVSLVFMVLYFAFLIIFGVGMMMKNFNNF